MAGAYAPKITYRLLSEAGQVNRSGATHEGTAAKGSQFYLSFEPKALREWLRQRPNDGSDFLFVSQKGGRLDRTQFFRLFKAIAADAGLSPEKQHPHVLKHSLASHLVAANVNLALVKQALGHKSINSTMRYIATTDKQASQATVTALMSIF